MSEAQSALPDDVFDPGLFRQPERARKDLEGICVRVPQGVVAALGPLLPESPDPDQALNLFERLVTRSGDELINLFDKNRVLLHHTLVIFGHSYWLGETLLHHPDIFYALHREKNLERSLGRDDYRESLARLRSRSVETDAALLLARFKRREYVRIALRDLLGVATLAVTAEEISALADVIVQEALREAESQMHRRFGRPEYQDGSGRVAEAPFAVLALGKLGGNELNYSSDVDLLYIYGGQESAGPLSLREYFIRQSQLLTEILSRATVEGSAFRIDLRLRPRGHEGEPAIGVAHALNYYAHVAHDWELQALIKARYVAGDAALARQFIRGVERKVYTESLNFEAIETALLSRERMGARQQRLVALRKGPANIDVKLDRGGIRDIEFLVQCLQRVYGGAEPWLRSGGTLFSLHKLHDKGHLSGKDFHELTVAYEFLRAIEHRLQLQRGQQVHRLPGETGELRIVERAVKRDVGAESPGAFALELQSHMARVMEIYERVIRSQRRGKQLAGEPEHAARALASEPASGLRPLSFDQVAQRAAADSPALRDLLVRAELGLHARRALHRFLSSAMTSAERYEALLEKPYLVERALPLLDSSDYLTDILVRHPDAVRVLEDLPRPPESEPMVAKPLWPVEAARDQGEVMAALRRGFRSQMFAVGAQDILAPRSAFDSMRETTALADSAIGAALRAAQGENILAVFALGRLGTREFDIASDADLLFVRDPETGDDQARTAAEKLVHILAAYTREGTLFAVDARLRPHGAAGELVVTPAQIERYLAEEAQPWEALTYTKLRFVTGREDVAELTLPPVWSRIVEMSCRGGFPQQVSEMRARLEKSNRYPRSFKLARGGFYDIDFIASFLMLKETSLRRGNTLERLENLQQNGLIDPAAYAVLQRATLLYRTSDHVIRLVTGRARPELPESEHARGAVEALVNKMLGRDVSADLQAELDETQDDVRELFVRVVRP